MNVIGSSTTRRVGCRIVSGAGGSASSQSPSPRGGAGRGRSGFGGRRAAGGVRHGRLERELLGGLDSERLRRQERPREEAQVLGQGDEHHRGPAELPGDGRRQDRRRARGLGQHARRVEQEVPDEQVHRPVGANGITGVIGWYIPRYLLKQYPQFKTWKGLKGKESSSRRQSRRPTRGRSSAVTLPTSRRTAPHQGARPRPEARVSGAEPAQVARWTQLYKQKKPVIFYWYDPQYLNAVYDLVRVKLPPRFKGCLDDEKLEGQAPACEYPARTISTSCLEQVREERLAGAEGDPEVQLDVGRPELRREPHLGEAHGQGQGRRSVGGGAQGHGQILAEVSRTKRAVASHRRRFTSSHDDTRAHHPPARGG